MSSAKKRTPSATYARKPNRRLQPGTSESGDSSVAASADMPARSQSSLKKSASQSNKKDRQEEEHGDKTGKETSAKKKKNDDDDEPDKENEDDSDQEDAYEVSEIKKHKLLKGEYKYKVGWKTYTSDDDTWEPEENLRGAKEMLKEYKQRNGLDNHHHKPRSARQSMASTTSKSTQKKSRSREEDSDDENDSDSKRGTNNTGSSKRKRIEKPTSSSIGRLNKNGFMGGSSKNKAKDKVLSNSKKNRERSVSSDDESLNSSEWHAQHRDEPSWEHLVKGIRTIEKETESRVKPKSKSKSKKNDDGEVENLLVCLLWHQDGRTTWVPNKVAREKLPQKLLDFYENHLTFAPPVDL